MTIFYMTCLQTVDTPYLLELNVKIIFIVFRMLVEVVTFIAILFFI